MSPTIENKILEVCNAKSISKETPIQALWNNYGLLSRVHLNGGNCNSVIVKHIKYPESTDHPRGWNTSLSHKRKVNSYRVESNWYNHFAMECNENCRVPECLHIHTSPNETIIILEDLADSGFPLVKTEVNLHELKNCISWLAYFHGKFLQKEPNGLWPQGTYWHLNTRPDELEALTDLPLKKVASIIDQKLDSTPYKTIVHGDAKLANFCFSTEGKVSMVDFQYTGGGCGMKDLAYFIGSCMYEEECAKYEQELLSHYFAELKTATQHIADLDFSLLKSTWKELYPYAWTDFHRFLKGWSPGHWKINSYSEKLAAQVIHDIKQQS